MDISSQLLLANKPLSSNLDPYLTNVVLYLKGDDTNGSTNIIDSSNNAKTISVFGSAQISTAQFKYGGSSILFNGNDSADYLTTPSHSDLDFGTGDFTFETWMYATQFQQDINNADTILDMRPDSTNGNYLTVMIRPSGSNIRLTINSIGYNFSSTISTNTWYHVAISRASGILKGFVDGVERYSDSHTNNLSSGATVKIGGSAFRSTAPLTYYFGYLDSLRITKGVARYTANFNPETDTYLAY